MKSLKRVVFLDRDGVINRDSQNFIKNWAEFEFLPGSIEAIRNLTVNGFSVILITNQSIINRNMATLGELHYTHAMMLKSIESQGGKLLDIFYCPHKPDDECDCRKPKPGLIYQAKQRYCIDLETACMVGDSATDIECARNAGCHYTILVRTRYGNQAEKALAEKGLFADHIADNLYESTDWIIGHI